ncbi:MAG: molybdate ABC transporter substrate-binding protein [Jhaorihella sp.]
MNLFLKLAVGAALALSAPLPAAAEVTVFAAASLKNALDAVATRFEGGGGTTVQVSYAGSSALARQIQQGAPAQIFISANTNWMDVLEGEGLLAAESRSDLLTNRLVLIAGPASDKTPELAPGGDLADALGEDGRLAMALVDAVPAGIYGKAALQSLGLWDSVADRVAQADNVRAALRLVAAGEAPLGIVYATDAKAEPDVRVVGVFPEDSHPPIVYPVAIVAGGDTPDARAFLAFLTGGDAGAVFADHGFGPGGAGQ